MITATAKTGKWDGVVTAFVTMSNIKDEIDREWPCMEDDGGSVQLLLRPR